MKLTEYLTDSFSREGIISEEDKEIVQFGLESLSGNLLGIVLILAIGIGFGHILEAILLWMFWFFLRKNAGGFHAKTKVGCLFVSVGMLMVSFVVFVIYERTNTFYLAHSLVAGSVIWLIAPIDNSMKQLDSIERKVYQRRVRILLCLEEAILLVAMVLNVIHIIRSINMAIFIVGASLVLGRGKEFAK